MKTLLRPICAAAALTALLAAPLSAQAHRSWLLPSSTVLSGSEAWVTVDGAVSNTLFVFEHVPMRLDGLTVTGPDGASVPLQNQATGKYRSTFDLELTKPGTYRIANAGESAFAAYKLNGEDKRWRGSLADLAAAVPAEATDVRRTHSNRRVETFVTLGEPTTEALAPTGEGLELAPVTHPNDLFAGETATFRLLLDGKPAQGVEITIVQGGERYRDTAAETKVATGADGTFQVTWPQPGMYWIEAETRGGQSSIPGAERSALYVATFEVLPE